MDGPESHGPESHGPESHGPESHGSGVDRPEFHHLVPNEPDAADSASEPPDNPADSRRAGSSGSGGDGSSDGSSNDAQPLDVPHTGDLAVDEALTRLAESTGLPLEEQVATFDAVHRTLQDRLADVDG